MLSSTTPSLVDSVSSLCRVESYSSDSSSSWIDISRGSSTPLNRDESQPSLTPSLSHASSFSSYCSLTPSSIEGDWEHGHADMDVNSINGDGDEKEHDEEDGDDSGAFVDDADDDIPHQELYDEDEEDAYQETFFCDEYQFPSYYTAISKYNEALVNAPTTGSLPRVRHRHIVKGFNRAPYNDYGPGSCGRHGSCEMCSGLAAQLTTEQLRTRVIERRQEKQRMNQPPQWEPVEVQLPYLEDGKGKKIKAKAVNKIDKQQEDDKKKKERSRTTKNLTSVNEDDDYDDNDVNVHANVNDSGDDVDHESSTVDSSPSSSSAPSAFLQRRANRKQELKREQALQSSKPSKKERSTSKPIPPVSTASSSATSDTGGEKSKEKRGAIVHGFSGIDRPDPVCQPNRVDDFQATFFQHPDTDFQTLQKLFWSRYSPVIIGAFRRDPFRRILAIKAIPMTSKPVGAFMRRVRAIGASWSAQATSSSASSSQPNHITLVYHPLPNISHLTTIRSNGLPVPLDRNDSPKPIIVSRLATNAAYYNNTRSPSNLMHNPIQSILVCAALGSGRPRFKRVEVSATKVKSTKVKSASSVSSSSVTSTSSSSSSSSSDYSSADRLYLSVDELLPMFVIDYETYRPTCLPSSTGSSSTPYISPWLVRRALHKRTDQYRQVERELSSKNQQMNKLKPMTMDDLFVETILARHSDETEYC